jgi:hypothetical protein
MAEEKLDTTGVEVVSMMDGELEHRWRNGGGGAVDSLRPVELRWWLGDSADDLRGGEQASGRWLAPGEGTGSVVCFDERALIDDLHTREEERSEAWLVLEKKLRRGNSLPRQ